MKIRAILFIILTFSYSCSNFEKRIPIYNIINKNYFFGLDKQYYLGYKDITIVKNDYTDDEYLSEISEGSINQKSIYCFKYNKLFEFHSWIESDSSYRDAVYKKIILISTQDSNYTSKLSNLDSTVIQLKHTHIFIKKTDTGIYYCIK
jgi:hypothetical protein